MHAMTDADPLGFELELELTEGLESQAPTWAVLSADGAYRYALGRRWGDGPAIVWVMLNPSTADATTDDPTIRRVVGFSRAWGAGMAVVVNLYALRATDPAELVRHADPTGPGNRSAVRELTAGADTVVAAWGAHPMALKAPVYADLAARLEHGLELKCLGRTKAGAPRHPLYVAGAQERLTWPR